MSGMEQRSNDATSIDLSFVKPGIVKCASANGTQSQSRLNENENEMILFAELMGWVGAAVLHSLT